MVVINQDVLDISQKEKYKQNLIVNQLSFSLVKTFGRRLNELSSWIFPQLIKNRL